MAEFDTSAGEAAIGPVPYLARIAPVAPDPQAQSVIYTGEPMTGTANDDFFIAYKGSTGADNNTVNGNGGDDLVIGDSSDTWIPNASYLNGAIGTAFNLETLTSTWTTAENQMFGDWTIPHTTVIAETTVGQSEYFRVAIGAGQKITVDIDFGSNTSIGTTRDLIVELQDSLGNILLTADDSAITDGGEGSFPTAPGGANSSDPYLTYTAGTGGIYYINVRPFGGGPGSTFAENDTFVMNVSVGGHAVNATNPVQGTDTINGGDGNDALFGQGGADVINGNDGDDFIDSGSGGDIVHGGIGNDTIYGGDGSEENIHGDDGNDQLFSGGEGHYYGDGGNDVIYAGLTSGVNEILDGGADNDTIDTRTWNGTYVVNLVTGVTNFGESFINFENVTTGNGDDTITGTSGDNVIITNGGADIVTAGDGNDLVAGGSGGDSLDGGIGQDTLDYRTSTAGVTVNLGSGLVSGGDASGDIISNFESVWGSAVGDTLTGNLGNNELRGYGGNDVLNGGGGNDILDGGANDDTMTGGIGDDYYMVDSAGDVVNEVAGEGTDTMALGFTYTVPAGSAVEIFRTIDPAATTAINLTGNADANTLVGNAGINTLTGGAGNDWLDGGGGNDVLVGGANDDTMIGGAGNDQFDGTIGADKMYGGIGDDQFTVASQSAQIFENVGEGTDTVISVGNFQLYDNIENLVLVGSGDIFGVGNALANGITGNGGANTLIGGGGNDTINAGAGVDILYGQDGNDTLNGEDGNDYMSGGANDDVMNGGNGGDSLYGEAGNDTLTGGADFVFDQLVGGDGNDVLHGDSGQADYDYLYGNAGDDSFYVDTGDDLTFEQAGEGTDTVYATVPGANNGVYLYANIENLVLLGTTSFGVGNTQANVITGNASVNTLLGGDGADTLNGKAGNDVLFGQAGADTFVFEHGTGGDVIGDFVPGTDKINLVAIGYTWTQVQNSMHQNGADLAIDLGGGDLIVLKGVTIAQLHQADFMTTGGLSEQVPVEAATTVPAAPYASEGPALIHQLWHGTESVVVPLF